MAVVRIGGVGGRVGRSPAFARRGVVLVLLFIFLVLFFVLVPFFVPVPLVFVLLLGLILVPLGFEPVPQTIDLEFRTEARGFHPRAFRVAVEQDRKLDAFLLLLGVGDPKALDELRQALRCERRVFAGGAISNSDGEELLTGLGGGGIGDRDALQRLVRLLGLFQDRIVRHVGVYVGRGIPVGCEGNERARRGRGRSSVGHGGNVTRVCPPGKRGVGRSNRFPGLPRTFPEPGGTPLALDLRVPGNPGQFPRCARGRVSS